ncbi:hypothetical protein HR09_01475 [Porphyromonas gulae]|nr:hypothetical protein HR09_01475 [Porphyromonas gulae]
MNNENKGNKEKQERKVVHLEIGGQHEYFGSIEKLFSKYTKEEIGFSIFQVRNNLKRLQIMESSKCIIRVGILQTKIRK